MMQDLIKRIEAAEGPDRESDAEIALAKGWVRRDNSDDWFYPPSSPVLHHKSELPNFTSSIDEAMTLVPEGWRVQLSDWDDDHLRSIGPWQAILTAPGARQLVSEWSPRCDHASTPALALCAAALRARL